MEFERVKNSFRNIEKIETVVVSIVVELLKDPEITRTKALEIFHLFQRFSCYLLEEKVLSTEFNVACDNVCASEHKFLNYLEAKKLYFPPVEVELGMTATFKQEQSVELVKSKKSCCLMQLRPMLEQFLTKPGMLQSIIEYHEHLKESKLLENVQQSTKWRALLPTDDRILRLPMVVAYDDFQRLNSIGVHSSAYTIGSVYIKFLSLPPTISSKLDSILPAQFFYANDRKELGSEVMFKPLVDALKTVSGPETKNLITVNHKDYDFVACLVFVLEGDNKSIAEAGGFIGASGNYPCNQCCVEKDTLKVMWQFDESIKRTETSYEKDLEKKEPSKTGIVEPSAFSSLPGFHPINNLGPDAFHDLPEGICHVEFAKALKHFIDQKFLNLNIFNQRLKDFMFSPVTANKPDVIKRSHIDVEKLPWTGAEMLLIFESFPFFIGDLIPPKDNFWILIIKLKEIIRLVLKKKLMDCDADILLKKVEDHHRWYVEVLKLPLRPKHHHLLHYKGKYFHSFTYVV